MSENNRLTYLHLMNKAAESEDRQSYYYYLKKAEAILDLQSDHEIWAPVE